MSKNAFNLLSYLEETRSKLGDETLPENTRTALRLIYEMVEQSLEEQQVERAARTKV